MDASYKIIISILIIIIMICGYFAVTEKFEIDSLRLTVSKQDDKLKELLSTINIQKDDIDNKIVVIASLKKSLADSNDNCKSTLSNLEKLYAIDQITEPQRNELSLNENKSNSNTKNITTVEVIENNVIDAKTQEYINLRNTIYSSFK